MIKYSAIINDLNQGEGDYALSFESLDEAKSGLNELLSDHLYSTLSHDKEDKAWEVIPQLIKTASESLNHYTHSPFFNINVKLEMVKTYDHLRLIN